MRTSKAIWLGSLVVVLGLGLDSRCAEKDKASHESVVKDLISIMNSASKSLGSVKDADSAKAATKQLKKETTRVRKLTTQAENLDKATDDQKQKVQKLQNQLQTAAFGFQKEASSLQDKLKKANISPDDQVALGKALQEFGNAMTGFSKAAKKLGQ